LKPATKRRKKIFQNLLCLFVFLGGIFTAYSNPQKGTLILTGGDPETGLKEFVTLAGGPDADIVYIPTAATSIKLPSGLIWEWLYADELPANTAAFKAELCKMFGITNITILHTRNRKTANSAGRVAIYDNQKHGSNWYHWLQPGDVFDLRTRSKRTAN